jgi:hypothetical protein
MCVYSQICCWTLYDYMLLCQMTKLWNHWSTVYTQKFTLLQSRIFAQCLCAFLRLWQDTGRTNSFFNLFLWESVLFLTINTLPSLAIRHRKEPFNTLNRSSLWIYASFSSGSHFDCLSMYLMTHGVPFVNRKKSFLEEYFIPKRDASFGLVLYFLFSYVV